MKSFGATTIIRKIILEGGLVAADGVSGDGAVGGGSGSSSGAIVGDNIAPLAVFETKNHFIYDHTNFTDFSSPGECSACKSQGCKAKHAGMINAIKALTASVKDCGLFVATYAKYLSDGLQVPNDGLDFGLLHKRCVTLLWKYREAKGQKQYASDIKDPRQSKPNSIAPDKEQLVHIE
ncbi:hypothetical protein CQW23_12261 [Capsicum baccatum]|uniref:Uncharacterized protein n=1 Tax=Capsicum baccatum TaxID=33114 RepID=A0A2G2WS39_CAPBA|nr:hypothetical protein CQW23_12261 [Capsicum baccatum]